MWFVKQKGIPHHDNVTVYTSDCTPASMSTTCAPCNRHNMQCQQQGEAHIINLKSSSVVRLTTATVEMSSDFVLSYYIGSNTTGSYFVVLHRKQHNRVCAHHRPPVRAGMLLTTLGATDPCHSRNCCCCCVSCAGRCETDTRCMCPRNSRLFVAAGPKAATCKR
jgi:hypothetical protein